MPEKRRLELGEGELAYVDAGDPANPTVLLLHGFPTSSFLWRAFVPALAPWFRVIAPDLPGFGDSPSSGDRDPADAGWVRELLGTLGTRRLAVAGHGIGGAVAQLLALDGPDVEALVLVDSVAGGARPTYGLPGPEGGGPALVAGILRRGMGYPDRLPEEAVAEYARSFRGEGAAEALARAAGTGAGEALAAREADLAGLEVPALILWGEDDPFVPVAVAERLSEVLPGSALALLPGCSHFLLEDAPETVVPLVVEYLRARYLGERHRHAEGPVPVTLGRPPWRPEGGP